MTLAQVQTQLQERLSNYEQSLDRIIDKLRDSSHRIDGAPPTDGQGKATPIILHVTINSRLDRISNQMATLEEFADQLNRFV
jgi:hypothetical protein